MQPDASAAKPLDSVPRHWVDSLPMPAQGFARLSRWDRPVGWRLLFMPCLMGLALARIGDGFSWPQDAIWTAAMLAGAIATRGAGCTYNDIVDKDIDAQVARTRARPIPAGQVGVAHAWLWLAAQGLAGLIAALLLPPTALIVAFCSVPFVAAYPFMKRITWWPQAWLGICFSWGALVAGAAADGAVTLNTVLLFIGCMAWVIGYDTIYALQDVEDDALIGVRSTARLFGKDWANWTYGFYAIAFAFWMFAANRAGGGFVCVALLALIGVAFAGPLVNRIDARSPTSALAAFKGNVWLGLTVAVALGAAAMGWTQI
jgi:4-hydroxybenzoate polyprenyltransferase